ncbi:unnamed protein product [Haemonchus placei]|uniref:Uncharacterized protein n=1 Tax=Haemonchus placei TaxID=6290 RepID=A0A0N4WJ14_HAEPC|nr:unnamed protein product [Haemonchus placei]
MDIQLGSMAHEADQDLLQMELKIRCIFDYHVSDRFSIVIQQCLKRADLANDVFLLNTPRENIKHQLVRNRLYDRTCITDNCVICPYGKVGDCAQRAVVYQLQCLTCDACYIGETGRGLCVRVKEQLANEGLARLHRLGSTEEKVMLVATLTLDARLCPTMTVLVPEKLSRLSG